MGGRIRQYQDLWVQGRTGRPGARECAARYAVVRAQIDALRLPPGHTVLDFGAAEGYFALRLHHETGARVTAVEGRAAVLRRALEANGLPAGIVPVTRRVVTGAAVRALGTFDVVLALSVLHHVERWSEVLDALQDVARHLLLVEPPHPRERIDAVKAPRIPSLHAEVARRGTCVAATVGLHPGRPRGIYALPGRALCT